MCWSRMITIICIITVPVVEEFGGDHDTCDEEAMDVERCDDDGGVEHLHLRSHEAIEVRIRDHEARRATICVLEDPLHVLFNANRGCTEPMEHCKPVDMVWSDPCNSITLITIATFGTIVVCTTCTACTAPLFFVFRNHSL